MSDGDDEVQDARKRKVALDANLLLRMWTRCYLSHVVVIAGHELVFPRTALEMAINHYDETSGKSDERFAVERWVGTNDPRLREDSVLFEVFKANVTAARILGFRRWVESEPLGDPSAWKVAERTEQTRLTAVFVRSSGLLTDPEDRRYGGTGEDAQVLAEAIEAGCLWIGTGNFSTIELKPLNRWLAIQDPRQEIQSPFVLKPEEAMDLMLPECPSVHLARVAYSVVKREDESEDRHLLEATALEKLQRGLRAGGLPRTAGAIRSYCATHGGYTSELAKQLEHGSGDLLEKTAGVRASEARRRMLERSAMNEVHPGMGGRLQGWPGVVRARRNA